MKYAVLISVIFKVLRDFLPISTHKSKKTNHKMLLTALREKKGKKQKPKAQIGLPQRMRRDFETLVVDWQICLHLGKNKIWAVAWRAILCLYERYMNPKYL